MNKHGTHAKILADGTLFVGPFDSANNANTLANLQQSYTCTYALHICGDLQAFSPQTEHFTLCKTYCNQNSDGGAGRYIDNTHLIIS